MPKTYTQALKIPGFYLPKRDINPRRAATHAMYDLLFDGAAIRHAQSTQVLRGKASERLESIFITCTNYSDWHLAIGGSPVYWRIITRNNPLVPDSLPPTHLQEIVEMWLWARRQYRGVTVATKLTEAADAFSKMLYRSLRSQWPPRHFNEVDLPLLEARFIRDALHNNHEQPPPPHCNSSGAELRIVLAYTCFVKCKDRYKFSIFPAPVAILDWADYLQYQLEDPDELFAGLHEFVRSFVASTGRDKLVIGGLFTPWFGTGEDLEAAGAAGQWLTHPLTARYAMAVFVRHATNSTQLVIFDPHRTEPKCSELARTYHGERSIVEFRTELVCRLADSLNARYVNAAHPLEIWWGGLVEGSSGDPVWWSTTALMEGIDGRTMPELTGLAGDEHAWEGFGFERLTEEGQTAEEAWGSEA